MIGSLLCSALLSFAVHQGDHHARALALLEGGDVGGAWIELQFEPDAFLKESALVRICHEAGDLGGVLRHARLALLERPTDPEVLFFAAWAHVSLRNCTGAANVVGRLAAGLAGAGFSAEEEKSWSGIMDRLEYEVGELRRLEVDRADKMARARVVSLTLLVLAGSLLGWSSIKGP